MELRIILTRTYRTGQGRLARTAHETAGLRQQGIHSARVKLLLITLAAALAGCAMAPPELRSQFVVRDAPFTPDSGTIAVHCGQLIDGVSSLPHGESLVLIRDGRIKRVQLGSGRGDAVAMRVPVLDL